MGSYLSSVQYKGYFENDNRACQALPQNDLERGEQYLLTKLYRTLNLKKYLLVLDDI